MDDKEAAEVMRLMKMQGHNNPPEAIELASGVISDISGYMADNPVVQDEEAAKAMKLHIDRAKLCIKDIEAERDTKVRPLNYKVEQINSEYRKPRRLLGDLLDEMLGRVQIFVKAEQQRRQIAAMEAERKAVDARLAAQVAERKERERLDDAAKGEVGVDVAEVIAEADEAFETYEKAERAAILAQKETHVKVGGGLGRSIGMRKIETLTVDSWSTAITDMGLTLDVSEAILKSARAFRKLNGRLPGGILSKIEEQL
jgi:hypothetical protein